VAPLLILKTGSTLPEIRSRRGDFEDWIRAGLGMPAERLRVVAVHEGEELPAPARTSGVVVTGSPAMVSEREPWSEKAAAWLRDAAQVDTPVLGICYGHQLLAHALGGHVAPNPRGREIGTTEVHLTPGSRMDPLLSDFPATLRVHTTHLESVLELPEGARRLAANEADPNHAFAWGNRTWGVQFHPEFDADVMRGYLRGRRDALLAEGLSPEGLEQAVTESPDGANVLRRFAEIASS